jgi:hypothetical protein
MWLMTTDGFFSVVQKNPADKDWLTVRARSREDLERMLRRTRFDKEITDDQGTDYPFRVRLPRWLVEEIATNYVKAITYRNFKDEVKAKRGWHHANVFGRIWGVLLDLEPKGSRWRKWDHRQGTLLDDPYDYRDEAWVPNEPTWPGTEAEDLIDAGSDGEMSFVTVTCAVCSEEVSVMVDPEVITYDDDALLREADEVRKVVMAQCQFTGTLSHYGTLHPTGVA